MSDIFREVDEEVRQDKALAFWERYQAWFLAAGVLIVIATGIWRFYETRQQAAAEAASAAFQTAVQDSRDGKSAQSLAALEEIAKTGTPGYRQLASLRAAAEIPDSAAAVKAYDAIVNDSRTDPLFRDAARLRAGMLKADSGDMKEIETRLGPLAAGQGPFRNSARELLAVAELSADNLDGAAKWLDEIVRDNGAPQDIRQRADAFLALVRSGRKPAK